jgi:hypothetical protein
LATGNLVLEAEILVENKFEHDFTAYIAHQNGNETNPAPTYCFDPSPASAVPSPKKYGID